MLFSKSHKTKTSWLSRVDVFQNDCVNDLTELLEMLFKFLRRQFEIKASNKDFWFRISKTNTIFICDFTIFSFNQNIWIRLLDLLSTSCHDSLTALIWLQRIHHRRSFLIIIGRLNIDSLFEYKMAVLFILIKDFSFANLCSFFVFKTHKNKTKSSTSTGCAVTHNNCIFNFSVILEISH